MDDQSYLSEQLRLLDEIGYSDSYQAAGIHSNKSFRDSDTNRDVRLLDTIAVALTTGKPGDVFAASFDKRSNMQLVLAKNEPPTHEDIAAANHLLSLINYSKAKTAIDIFPFLIERCGTNINKRIRNLHISLQGEELQRDLSSALKTYESGADMQVEFPGSGPLLRVYRGGVPSFAIVWRDFVGQTINLTAHGLDAENIPSSTGKYAEIFSYADALRRSRFLKALVDDHKFRQKSREERVEKLKRRLAKVCQYISGISNLMQKAERMRPITHRWVTDTFAGTGEGAFNLCDHPHDAVRRGLNLSSLSQEIQSKLDNRFPFMPSNWASQQTVHARVHAEIRIILDLGLPSLPSPAHPIGVSKRSCLCCVLWIDSHNCIFGTQWMTSGSHGKPYANWALPGIACSYAVETDARSSVDKAVLQAVSVRLTDVLDQLFPSSQRISDEHVSSSGDSSDKGEGTPEWRRQIDAIVSQRHG